MSTTAVFANTAMVDIKAMVATARHIRIGLNQTSQRCIVWYGFTALG